MDLRIVKTHKTIRQAFIKLLIEQPFEKISVQQILEEALVNRTTFYKYYSSKSDLAGKIIADFKMEYQAFLAERIATTNLADFIERNTQAMFSKRELLLALWEINTKRHHLYQDMFQMIEQSYMQLAEKFGKKDRSYQAMMFATMLLTSAKYYFERNQMIPVMKMMDEWEEICQVAKDE